MTIQPCAELPFFSDDLWQRVFHELDPATLCVASRVCKQWQLLMGRDSLWKQHVWRDYPFDGGKAAAEGQWKAVYIENAQVERSLLNGTFTLKRVDATVATFKTDEPRYHAITHIVPFDGTVLLFLADGTIHVFDVSDGNVDSISYDLDQDLHWISDEASYVLSVNGQSLYVLYQRPPYDATVVRFQFDQKGHLEQRRFDLRCQEPLTRMLDCEGGLLFTSPLSNCVYFLPSAEDLEEGASPQAIVLKCAFISGCVVTSQGHLLVLSRNARSEHLQLWDLHKSALLCDFPVPDTQTVMGLEDSSGFLRCWNQEQEVFELIEIKLKPEGVEQQPLDVFLGPGKKREGVHMRRCRRLSGVFVVEQEVDGKPWMNVCFSHEATGVFASFALTCDARSPVTGDGKPGAAYAFVTSRDAVVCATRTGDVAVFKPIKNSHLAQKRRKYTLLSGATQSLARQFGPCLAPAHVHDRLYIPVNSWHAKDQILTCKLQVIRFAVKSRHKRT